MLETILNQLLRKRGPLFSRHAPTERKKRCQLRKLVANAMKKRAHLNGEKVQLVGHVYVMHADFFIESYFWLLESSLLDGTWKKPETLGRKGGFQERFMVRREAHSNCFFTEMSSH